MEKLQSIGVVGAGVVGTGVAQALAETGLRVVLVDRTDMILASALRKIRLEIAAGKLLGSSSNKETIETVLSRIKTASTVDALAEVEFVIENVTEVWAVKSSLYRMMTSKCSSSTVFAANTSAISITRIASLTGCPERVVGIHFMNPVPLVSTVELIRGFHTSDQTMAIAEELLSRIGKRHVLVEDLPGFISNRVLMITINEAASLLQEHAASAADIDRVFRECCGHKMGPLETADLIGLDTVANTLNVLFESYGYSKYHPCNLINQMVHAGKLGRKVGEGFFKYE